MEQKTALLAMGVEKAAKAVDLSPWTIRKMIRDGKLKATRFNRRVLIEPRELEKLVAGGRDRANRYATSVPNAGTSN